MAISVDQKLEKRLMDIVTVYLYGLIDKTIYMRVPAGFDGENCQNKCVRLLRAIYGLKQAGWIWFQQLKDFLLHKKFQNDEVCPCLFIRRDERGLVIVAVYVDDLNIVGTSDAITAAAAELKSEFEIKDLGVTTYCLGLQLENFSQDDACGIFVHQTTYTRRVLKRFGMDTATPLAAPMVVRKLDPPSADPY